MAIKPILFNIEMVRAILDERKTCTRRLIKHNVDTVLNSPYHKEHPETEDAWLIKRLCRAPYEPGDILYIRETWAWCPCWDCGLDVEETGCGHEEERVYNGEKKEYGCYMYRASCEDNEYPSADVWHPSIHMPKEAARIWLKVTDVRVERLQEITEDDTFEEGLDFVPPCLHLTGENYCDIDGPCTSEIKYCDMSAGELFGKVLWNNIIKKSDLDRYGWEANPYVWVISFERCEKPEGV